MQKKSDISHIPLESASHLVTVDGYIPIDILKNYLCGMLTESERVFITDHLKHSIYDRLVFEGMEKLEKDEGIEALKEWIDPQRIKGKARALREKAAKNAHDPAEKLNGIKRKYPL